jgi:hypothetical protein
VTDGPLCVFCGNEFPVELERCPSCGRPWIDQRITDVAEGTIVPLGEVGDVGESSVDTEPQRRVPLWLIGGGVALVAITVYGIVFSLLLSNGDDQGDAAAGGTTTTTVARAPATTTVATTVPPPETTAAPQTTTQPPPPTTSTTTTTTTTLPPITEGAPIPVDDLTLGAFALGPLQVGSSGSTALARLAGTFGQPTEITDLTGGDLGICETDTGRAVRFGWVTVIVIGDEGAETFVGYRYDEGPDGHPSAGLRTLSGATIGNTVTEVDAIYVGPLVEIGEVDERPHLFVLRSSDRRTLLWGPVSGSNEDAIVQGIYAPYWCDDGPAGP